TAARVAVRIAEGEETRWALDDLLDVLLALEAGLQRRRLGPVDTVRRRRGADRDGQLVALVVAAGALLEGDVAATPALDRHARRPERDDLAEGIPAEARPGARRSECDRRARRRCGRGGRGRSGTGRRHGRGRCRTRWCRWRDRRGRRGLRDRR